MSHIYNSNQDNEVEKDLFIHLNGLSHGILQWSAKKEERVQAKEEIEKHISHMNALIPSLAPSKMIDAYHCLEKIQDGSQWIFLEIEDSVRAHEAMTSISSASSAFIAILNWGKEG